MIAYPQIDNAPGVTWRLRKNGWEARWEAGRDHVRAGYRPKRVKIWVGPNFTAGVAIFVSDRCRELQSEMLCWEPAQSKSAPIAWDGMLHSLIDAYRHDPISEYHSKRYVTRQNYDTLCKRILQDRGSTTIAEIKYRTLKEWHNEWVQSGVTMAHQLMQMIGILLNFGMTVLEQEECAKVALLKSKSRFQNAKPRTQIMTPDEVAAVIAEAHRRGKPSIALAQAFGFECSFRQKDVIGERVPADDKALGYLNVGNEKWLRGLLWEEIDAAFVLHHVTSKKEKLVEPPLLFGPMVVDELRRSFPGCITEEVDEAESKRAGRIVRRLVPHREFLPASGPMIIAEETGAPYKTATFRRQWRTIATAIGISKDVKQMDTRASSVTEASNAGVPHEIMAKATAHANLAQTADYDRAQSKKHGMAMKARADDRARQAHQRDVA